MGPPRAATILFLKEVVLQISCNAHCKDSYALSNAAKITGTLPSSGPHWTRFKPSTPWTALHVQPRVLGLLGLQDPLQARNDWDWAWAWTPWTLCTQQITHNFLSTLSFSSILVRTRKVLACFHAAYVLGGITGVSARHQAKIQGRKDLLGHWCFKTGWRNRNFLLHCNHIARELCPCWGDLPQGLFAVVEL